MSTSQGPTLTSVLVLMLVLVTLATVACGSNTALTIETIVTVESQSLPTWQSVPSPTNMPTTSKPGRTCTLTGGEVVQDGWYGKNNESNFCNRCFCTDGALACTKIACQANPNPIMNIPRLKNLLIKNLGPYDPEYSTFGDLKYDMSFGGLVFHDFARLLHGSRCPGWESAIRVILVLQGKETHFHRARRRMAQNRPRILLKYSGTLKSLKTRKMTGSAGWAHMQY